MKLSTKALHEKFSTLGEDLGFTASREVSSSLLSLRVRDAYSPRIDLMWSLPLDAKKRMAIAEVTGEDVANVTHLPIVGIEIEGSSPTTKTLMSDIANIRALGAPLGLLVISVDAEADQYRRAARAIRTVRRNLGDLSTVPVEASWVGELLSTRWDTRSAVFQKPRKKGARGGETRKWNARTRDRLTKLGKEAGFVIADPFRLREPQARFKAERARRTDPMREMWAPKTPEIREMKKGGQYMTASEIDLAWLMPLPRSLRAMLEALVKLDPTLAEHDIVFPQMWDRVPVVGFELDSQPGKHGGGGLLNLSSYCVIGVTFTPNEVVTKKLEATLKTYVQALGLRNVYVRTAP